MTLRIRVGGPVQPVYSALSQGRLVVLRVAADGDAPALVALLTRCGPRTRSRRLAGAAMSGPHPATSPPTGSVSPPGGCVVVAETAQGDLVAMAQIATAQVVAGNPPTADLAVLVREDHQRLGLGAALARRAVDVAAALGFRELAARGSADDPRLAGLLLTLGLTSYARTTDGLLTVRAPLDAVASPAEHPRRRARSSPAA